jgi:hypothetical protein
VTRPPIVFFTYYRVTPVGQMGVFKRCVRLFPTLLDDFDVHLVNFGPLPESEATFASVRDQVTVHEVPEADVGRAAEGILCRVEPRAVILGEAPVRGSMRVAHRAALRLGIWQIGIENTFDRRFAPYLAREWPSIDRWLLVGLLENGFPERLSTQCTAVPPLVRFPADFGSLKRDRIAVIGYDRESLLTGLSLLDLLPGGQPADVFVSPEGLEILGEPRDGMRVLVLPDDAAIYDSLSRARLVVGKAGYNQIVESLQLGAPILCRARGGGVPREWVAGYMEPFVRIVDSRDELPGCLPDVERWLASEPVSTFAEVAARVPDPVAFAARAVADLIEEQEARSPTSPPPELERMEPLGFYEFKWAVERQQWDELRRLVEGARIWIFDRELSPGELIEVLQRLFADATGVKLIALIFQRDRASCVLLWSERDSWREHELEFELRLAWREEGGQCRFDDLSVTAAAP